MAYYLSHLLQDAYRALGKTETLILTGGSTTTIVDSKLLEKYSDDDLIDWTCFITRDSGGASAAPENEFSRISGYVASTWTATVDTAFTVAPAAGDIATLASDQFPLREMIALANIAIQYLGDIVLVDTSITTASSQTEYTLPVACKRDRLVKVQYQEITTDANDNKYSDIPENDYYLVPAAPGSTGLITFRVQYPADHTIKMWYEGVHPTLSVYNSVIAESIHPNIARASLVAHALEWHNTMLAGQDEFWLQRENKAWRDLEIALAKHPIWKPAHNNKLLTVSRGTWEEDDFTWPDPA